MLDARQGYWQERKAAWLSLGIVSEIGRGANLLKFSDRANEASLRHAKRKRLTMAKGHKAIVYLDHTTAEILQAGEGSSIFDPVVCKLAYRWFCPHGGMVLDPFAAAPCATINSAIPYRRTPSAI